MEHSQQFWFRGLNEWISNIKALRLTQQVISIQNYYILEVPLKIRSLCKERLTMNEWKIVLSVLWLVHWVHCKLSYSFVRWLYGNRFFFMCCRFDSTYTYQSTNFKVFHKEHFRCHRVLFKLWKRSVLTFIYHAQHKLWPKFPMYPIYNANLFF